MEITFKGFSRSIALSKNSGQGIFRWFLLGIGLCALYLIINSDIECVYAMLVYIFPPPLILYFLYNANTSEQSVSGVLPLSNKKRVMYSNVWVTIVLLIHLAVYLVILFLLNKLDMQQDDVMVFLESLIMFYLMIPLTCVRNLRKWLVGAGMLVVVSACMNFVIHFANMTQGKFSLENYSSEIVAAGCILLPVSMVLTAYLSLRLTNKKAMV